MTEVNCSNDDCKHHDNNRCQLEYIFIDWERYCVGGLYVEIPYCTNYEQEVRDD